jgi:hypothetical protein
MEILYRGVLANIVLFKLFRLEIEIDCFSDVLKRFIFVLSLRSAAS